MSDLHQPENQHEKSFQGQDHGGMETENMRSMTPPPFQLKANGMGNANHNMETTQSENKTGLPDDLKAGTEALSGKSMDDVKVHYNSSNPGKVGAHAYAQGTDIHVAPGQEKHLAHEAWHVVQQKENRVKADTNINNAPVNTNQGLETEADVMGAKALQTKADPTKQLKKAEAGGGAMQQMSSVIQREPIRRQAGTIDTFIQVFNNTPSRMGTLTGTAARDAMLRLAETEITLPNPIPMPSTTPYFNERDGRYVYTTSGGWIDMVHFLFYAGKAFKYKLEAQRAQQTLDEFDEMPWYLRGFIDPEVRMQLMRTANQSPVGEAVQDGFMQERADSMFAQHSAYSYEDLPSDTFGARFAVQHFNPDLNLTFGEQLHAYMVNVLGATEPTAAPNYDDLPETTPETPTRTNHTTTPVYTSANP